MSLIGAILKREPPPVGELQPMTPPALARIVRTCLKKNPDDRFQPTLVIFTAMDTAPVFSPA
jgi:hypothetical protein